EVAHVQKGIEQGSQRFQAHPEHAACDELVMALTWYRHANTRAELRKRFCVVTPVAGHRVHVPLGTHQPQARVVAEGIGDGGCALWRSDTINEFSTPEISIAAVDGTLCMQFQDHLDAFIEESVGHVEER